MRLFPSPKHFDFMFFYCVLSLCHSFWYWVPLCAPWHTELVSNPKLSKCLRSRPREQASSPILTRFPSVVAVVCFASVICLLAAFRFRLRSLLTLERYIMMHLSNISRRQRCIGQDQVESSVALCSRCI